MRFTQRLRLGMSIIFGRTYGIIIDGDYAKGGTISNFNIKNADVGMILFAEPNAILQSNMGD